MFLLIDAGNSRIKYGLHDGHSWLRQAATERAAPQFDLPASGGIHRIVVSNVAGEAFAAQIRPQLEALGAPLEWLRASAHRCGLSNTYDHPASLGADRWAAAIGAWPRLERDGIVVSAGTATTIDILRLERSEAGLQARFDGGCILPGLGMMANSLARDTANLPRARGAFALPPRNTEDAITTGCLLAQAGAIERMAASLGAGTPVFVTGGNAPRILPHLGACALHQPGLVLEGLLRIATEGAPA